MLRIRRVGMAQKASVFELTADQITSILNYLKGFPETQDIGPDFFKREDFYKKISQVLRQKTEQDEFSWDEFDFTIGRLVAAKEWFSEHDFLTGLGNVRAYQQELEIKIAESKRYGIPLTVISMDMDNFKLLNDEKGHPAGNEFLKNLGALILNKKRKEDSAFRVGGDEMVIIAFHTTSDQAEFLIKRLQQDIQNLIDSSFSGTSKPLGVSFGKAELRRKENLQEFEKRIDEDLYQKKRLKKNG